MRIGFTCPSGRNVLFDECIKKCPEPQRCATTAQCIFMARVREWKGKPSVTQCLNGTRCAMNEILYDYYTTTDSMAFAMLGTHHHTLMEGAADGEEIISEERFEADDVGGTPDSLEPKADGTYKLLDYKTWGSYKVAKALGYYTEDVGTGVHFKTGKRVGQEKTRKEVRQSADKVDIWETQMQLNRYRIFFDVAGFPVSELEVAVTVRDSGTYMAKGRGVTRNIYLINIPILPDEYVLEYFKTKSEALVSAIANKHCPTKCNARERWDDRKCEDYCPTHNHCEYWQEKAEHSA